MEKPIIYDTTCRARRTDPSSSHEAARDASKAKQASDKMATLHWAAVTYPGHTALELAEKVRKEWPDAVASWGGQTSGNFACRNLSKLRDQQHVLQNSKLPGQPKEKKKCTECGRKCIVWRPVQKDLLGEPIK